MASVLVSLGMSTDVSHLSASASATTAAAPTSGIPVNRQAVDTGIRLPVERVPLDELLRRQQADVPSRVADADLDATLPSNVSVLQAMIVELRQAIASRNQRVTELEQSVNELSRRLHTPRDAWSPDQPALFPEAHQVVMERSSESMQTLDHDANWKLLT